MARRLLFWLFVTKLKKPRDDDGLPSGFLSANAASAESGDQPGGGKWLCRYCNALFDDGGWWVVMLDNNLYLVSVVWFLRRSHVDRGTRGGKVVVGTDLSKRKVIHIISMCPNTLYLLSMDAWCSLRWLSASTMSQWHHFWLLKWPRTSKSEPTSVGKTV